MSFNWTPVPRAPTVEDNVPPCAGCLHRADVHHDATSCSARGRWGRRCKCGGYIRSESTSPIASPPPSPADG
jgi:hypothetical protein